MSTISISATVALVCFFFMRLSCGRSDNRRTMVLLLTSIGMLVFTWRVQAEISGLIPKAIAIFQCGLGTTLVIVISDRIFYSNLKRS